MEYCMENLGNHYKDSEQIIDNEYVFFDKYLKEYLNDGITEGIVIAKEEDDKKFFSYKEEYNLSKDRPYEEKNETEVLADSYAFFISNATLIVKNAKHYINLEKVLNLYNRYSKATEIGNSKKMGTR